MAFPLSKILNRRNESPQRKRKRKRIESGEDDNDEVNPFSTDLNVTRAPAKSHKRPLTVAQKKPNEGQLAVYNSPLPITFSPEKGSLYNRRACASPTRVAHLPTPPLSQPRPPAIRLPTPSPPTPELDLREFSVFKAFLNHPELVFEMTKHLDIEDLISLYAISKEFHVLANTRFTTMILSQSLGKAAESSRTFIFKCYRNLCMVDPAARPNESVPIYPRQAGPSRNVASMSGVTSIEKESIRSVPSFRWLRMILYRERVVDGILSCLEKEGHHLPKRASIVLKKLWFTLDISDNARRVALVHNKPFWGNKDLFVATMFFIKLDMRLTDPMLGTGETGLRSLLLNQRSLTLLHDALQRRTLTSQLDLLRLLVRHHYNPRRPLHDQSVCGVPAKEVGQLQYEGWGSGKPKLFLKVENLVAKEGIRRGLGIEKHYLDMMLHGYINKETWEDIWTSEQLKARKKRERQEARWKGEEVEAGASSPEKKDDESGADGENVSSGEKSIEGKRNRGKRSGRNSGGVQNGGVKSSAAKRREGQNQERNYNEGDSAGDIGTDGLSTLVESTQEENSDNVVSSMDDEDNDMADMNWEGYGINSA